MKKNLLKICVSISIILMVIFSIMTIKLLSNEKDVNIAENIESRQDITISMVELKNNVTSKNEKENEVPTENINILDKTSEKVEKLNNNTVMPTNNDDEKLKEIKEFVEKNDIVNISECSTEFMDNYFKEVEEFNKELEKKDTETQNEIKSNMLIVFSKEDEINDYGATKAIKCPNNQYMLVYENTEDMKQAKDKLNKDEKVLKVENNNVYKIFETDENIEKDKNIEKDNIILLDNNSDIIQKILNEKNNKKPEINNENIEVNNNIEKMASSKYNSWGVEFIGLDVASNKVNEKKLDEIAVAIIDTGCDLDLFKSKYPKKLKGSYNVLENTTVTDEQGHGTHIAGTIAESTPDNVKVYPIKVSTGITMYDSDIILGINHVIDNNIADVINMSFGGFFPNLSMYTAIQSANSKNIICVAAAGNDGVSAKSYPASYDCTMSIGASDNQNKVTNFSNYNDMVTFVAPGKSILSINGTMSGTSMATPHAVSAVAILKSYNKNYSLQEVINILKEDAIDEGIKGKDSFYGYGILNLKELEYCNCNCEDCYELSCEGCECVTCKYYKPTISEISVVTPTNVLAYNYGTITNLSNVLVNIKYSNNTEEQVKLLELENCEIEGYNPYLYESQEIIIKYSGFTTTFTLNVSNEYESGWGYEVKEDDTIKLTEFKLTDDMEKIVMYIPEKIDGKFVSELGMELFFEQALLYKVYIPASVTTIAEWCFWDCDSLVYVEALASELNILDGGFEDCEALKEVNFNAETLNLGSEVFEWCISLETDMENIKSIGEYTFLRCNNVKVIELEEGIIEIPSNAFAYSGIQQIVLPNSVKTIGDSAMQGCYNLESVTLPASLETIGNSVFNLCANIRKIEIPASTTSIGKNCFDGCSLLLEILVDENNKVFNSKDNCNAIIETATNKLLAGTVYTAIPNTVKVIGDNAFNGRLFITSVEVPEGITSIESSAFSNCSELQEVLIPKSLTSMKNDICKNSSYAVVKVYQDTYSEEFVIANKMKYAYRIFQIKGVNFSKIKGNYKAFETVDMENVKVSITLTDESVIELDDKYQIIYQNETDSFRAGDTYYYYVYDNKKSIAFGVQIKGLNVAKATPTYTVPTNLSIKKGETLSKIVLPKGFSWMEDVDTKEEILTVGNLKYKVKYTPQDTNNYEIVPNIEVIVNVQEVKPTEIKEIKGVTKTEYTAFEKVNEDNLSLLVLYETGVVENKTNNIIIEYANANDGVRFGDTYYIVKYTEGDVELQKQVSIVVNKATPTYTVPTGLIAKRGQKLSEVKLPEGFSWMDSSIVISEIGNKTYKATYTPKDLENYKSISEISVIISVIKEEQDIKFEDVKNENGFISGIIAKQVDVNNNVVASTKVKDLKDNIKLSKDLVYEVYNVLNEKLSLESDIATGCVIKIYSQPTSQIKELVKSFNIVIYGDTSCDGIINSGDLLVVKKHLLKTKLFTNDAVKEAADINQDGDINSGDLLLIKKHLLKKQIIIQNKY